ncbi:MAG: bifunctional diaminohydroxyphosphoribosylaminopyrimidine deaminase/5-amino-6-(5-phosphoribosylamino)uracil reductase RibD [Pseudomonadales bacterium]|nr:bifunctional diaminohydroxyphosphoribosylaminopyrimidine deaminase/5-amino-6-(5-phosphoribosylamino)uracil reductase RibD [Pseudomonadales bacterium]
MMDRFVQCRDQNHDQNHDQHWMAQAIQLGQKGLYSTDPNPRVGCVLVKDGEIVGEGWHRKAGQAHAEIEALKAAGSHAKGATAYVTLEPCSHQGRTPPCCDALIKAGVGRVVAAMEDPNPLVSGQGFAQLQQAGIEVSTGVLQADAEALNPGYIKRHKTGLPLVRLKLAMSLDGRTAMANGESQWITGPDARQDVQKWRGRSSAIVTGIGSLLKDDPQLNVRRDDLAIKVKQQAFVRQPLRVVLDPSLRTPVDAKALKQPGEALIIGSLLKNSNSAEQDKKQQLQDAGAEVLLIPEHKKQLDLQKTLQILAQRGCNEVLFECGATLAGSALQQGWVDELLIYMAPTLLGNNAQPLMKLLGLDHIDQQIHLNILQTRMIGKDLRIMATTQQ